MRLRRKVSYRKRKNFTYTSEYQTNDAKTITTAGDSERFGSTFCGLQSVHDRARAIHIQGDWGIYDDPLDETIQLGLTIYDLNSSVVEIRPDLDCEWSDRQLWRVLTSVGVVQTLESFDDDVDIEMAGDAPDAADLRFGLIGRSDAQSAINVHATLTVEHTIRQHYSPKRSGKWVMHQ